MKFDNREFYPCGTFPAWIEREIAKLRSRSTEDANREIHKPEKGRHSGSRVVGVCDTCGSAVTAFEGKADPSLVLVSGFMPRRLCEMCRGNVDHEKRPIGLLDDDRHWVRRKAIGGE